jgi:hypothetical protein
VMMLFVAIVVLSGDRLEGQARGHGRMVPDELRADEGRLRVRIHVSTVEEGQGHIGDLVVPHRR